MSRGGTPKKGTPKKGAAVAASAALEGAAGAASAKFDVNHALMARVEEALNDISKVTVAVQEDPRCRPDSQATPPAPRRFRLPWEPRLSRAWDSDSQLPGLSAQNRADFACLGGRA